jgi:hypothetical protein
VLAICQALAGDLKLMNNEQWIMNNE